MSDTVVFFWETNKMKVRRKGIPPNHAVPAPGEVVECQFLYGFKESGSIYQPVDRGKRCDIPASECTKDQLKYKSQDAA